MDTFDQKIIPTDREFFGSEGNPGVDGDPHIYVLYAGGLGTTLADISPRRMNTIRWCASIRTDMRPMC